MQNAAKRMRTLIRDLLSLARVTTKGEEFAPVDLDSVVREVLSDLEIRIEEQSATVDVGNLPAIQGDPTQKRQLFQNLISNALKFRRDDVAPSVQIQFHEDEGQIVINDNGIGFETEQAERIFGAFERLHGRSEYDGTGIGLAVCKKIVERHGGQIEAQGVPGESATFFIALPLDPRGKSPE